MTAPGAPAAPPDPWDPNYYDRGDRWPGEKLRPLVLTPAEEQLQSATARPALGAQP
ncbi:hypothetical protein [Streptomyces sp. NBC_01506]|uniref:hypothetical protein n=1 Tax=Streptomyces sp. NBC_01506 TaxID=2903887 RepID=UPI00386FD9C3